MHNTAFQIGNIDAYPCIRNLKGNIVKKKYIKKKKMISTIIDKIIDKKK